MLVPVDDVASQLDQTGLTIPDFTAIPFELFNDIILQNVLFSTPSDDEILTLVSEFVEELCPDLAAVVFAERIILDDNVNSGNEGIIKMPYTIGGQEQDAPVVFDATEEDFSRILLALSSMSPSKHDAL